MVFFERPVTMRMSVIPARTASSTTYWMPGRSTSGIISLGMAFVAGKNRVPRPAAGMTALRTIAMTIGAYVAELSVSPVPLALDIFEC